MFSLLPSLKVFDVLKFYKISLASSHLYTSIWKKFSFDIKALGNFQNFKWITFLKKKCHSNFKFSKFRPHPIKITVSYFRRFVSKSKTDSFLEKIQTWSYMKLWGENLIQPFIVFSEFCPI